MVCRLLLLTTIVTNIIITLAYDTIDYNICDPIHAKQEGPPPPGLAPTFTAHIEWKWEDTNSTVDIIETYNSITQLSSQTMYIEGQKIQILYDDVQTQKITYTEAEGCVVKPMNSIEFYDNKLWLATFRSLYNVARPSYPSFKGQQTVRSTLTNRWDSCLYFYQLNITVLIEMHFSVSNWAMPLSAPDALIPVRIKMHGSTDAGEKNFTAVGDIIEYDPRPPDEKWTQLPAGAYCMGRYSRIPLHLLPRSFSLVSELITSTLRETTVTYEKIWFNSEKKLVRKDYKSAAGNDPDPTSEVFDFNLGIHYHMDSYMGTCDPISSLSFGDLFVASGPNSTIRMVNADEFFHADAKYIQYVGTKSTRGVDCDVWSGMYVDPDAGRNFTIEWYFTKKDIYEGVGTIVEPAALFRYDIWQGNGKAIVRNILQFNSDAPQQEVFDVSQCFPFTYKARLLFYFSVVNDGDLTTVSSSYLKDTLHISVVNKAFLPPLRISGVTIQSVGSSEVYMDAILLDKAPVVNDKIVPPPPPQHRLEAAFDFLKGAMGGRWNISLDSTATRNPVIIQSRGILRLNYTEAFTIPTTTTTHSTTEATPSPPTPPMVIPDTPTKERGPPTLAPTTLVSPQLAPCTCPIQTCPTPSSTQIAIMSKTPCPTAQTTTPPSTVTCPPKQTCQPCPRCTQAIQQTQTTLKCPPVTTPSPCPTIKNTKPAASSAAVSSISQTSLPYPGQNRDKQSSSESGMGNGAAAGLAIGMFLLGAILVIVGVFIVQKIKVCRSPEERNILREYLNDDTKY